MSTKTQAVRSSTQKFKRRARTFALQLTYAFDVKRCQDDDHLVVKVDGEQDGEAWDFAQALFKGLQGELPAVDAVVDGCLTNWNLARLAVPDRSILRLGCYELLYRSDTPPKVAINEYIELAKIFGSDGKTAKLVNGVLDRIAREHRGDEVRAAKSAT